MPKYTRDQLDYLRLRAYQGVTNVEYGIPKDQEGLTEEELGEIISELQQTSDTSYQRSLIGVIYYAGYPERERYRTVLEPFFRDPHHAEEILRILCREWDLTAHYKQELREFIRGVPWDWYPNDSIGRCQQMAVDLVFEKWQRLTDPTLLQEVIALYELHKGDSAGRNARDAAYRSLWRLLGSPYVSEGRTIDLAKELASRLEASVDDPEVLKRISKEFIEEVSPKLSVEDHIVALHHENPTVRDNAAQSLGSIGDRHALGPLVDVMTDKNENVFTRESALRAIARFGTNDLDPLMDVLTDNREDEWLRHSAAVFLGKHGDKRALQALIALSEDKTAMLGEEGYSLLGYAVNNAIDELRSGGVVL